MNQTNSSTGGMIKMGQCLATHGHQHYFQHYDVQQHGGYHQALLSNNNTQSNGCSQSKFNSRSHNAQLGQNMNNVYNQYPLEFQPQQQPQQQQQQQQNPYSPTWNSSASTWEIREKSNSSPLSHKSAKSPEAEANSSKIYGNAYLGQNLWDKNDLFQGEKLGVKFETLDFEDFLNENSLNESDVEFLDRLQHKAETSANNNNNKSPQQQNKTSTQPISICQKSPSNQPSTNSSIKLVKSSKSAGLIIEPSEISIDSFSIGSYSNGDDPSDSLGEASHRYATELLDLAGSSLGSDGKATSPFFELSKKSKKLIVDPSNDYLMDQFDGFNEASKLASHQFIPSEMKDEKYWTRRRKNNLAAKRSRDARRMKENQIAIRASFLERENDTLKKQLDDTKRENKLLKLRLARYEFHQQQQQQQH